MQLLEMPSDCLRKIFSFLTFHEISLIRPVCRKFNAVAADLLKCEFCRLEQLVRDYRRELKLLLPRRESERRKHTLAGHADVLSAVETRLSLLGMTIMRYVDEGYCCFFPGKVLDELRRVYMIIKSSTSSISRSTELLRELRDISSMAMEHFDEVLLPQIYESKLHRQQQSLGELTYQRRGGNLQHISLFKDLNQSLPNLLDGSIAVPPSSTVIPSSATENRLSQSNRTECCESTAPEANDLPTIAQPQSLTKQIDAMQQTIVSFATTQREMAKRIGRLNNMVISLGYRLHRLEAQNGIHAPEKQDAVSFKRSHAAVDGSDRNGGFCRPNKMKRHSALSETGNCEPSLPSSSNA
ncbi:F-box only protein 28 [Echinococcus granulosus]|nr:F-box only protein 28 [Echinococcus granulosus]